MRSEQEIRNAIEEINNNNDLIYSYKEDVINILEWVLGGEGFLNPDWRK